MATGTRDTPDTEIPLTLEDLRKWSRVEPSLAVVGKPIGHSLSPRMHNAALAELSRTLPQFTHWRYFKFEIDPTDLAEALRLFHQKRFVGLNLTLPHKVIACPLVAGLSSLAQAIGAVNTLIWHDVGYYGHNTDGPGFARGIREDLDIPMQGANIILLGAGGAARAIATIALKEGCRSLWIGNRNPQRLAQLVAQITEHLPEATTRIHTFPLENPPTDLPADCVLVNATQLGLKTSDPSPFPADRLRPEMVAYDIIYEPTETPFLRAARQSEILAANGLSMLYWQGALALELWTHTRAPVHAMAEALRGAGNSAPSPDA